MFTQHDVQILIGQLPTRPVKLIRQKTKISRPTIYKFLNGTKIRTELAQIIYEAVKLIIEEKNASERLFGKVSSSRFKVKPHVV